MFHIFYLGLYYTDRLSQNVQQRSMCIFTFLSAKKKREKERKKNGALFTSVSLIFTLSLHRREGQMIPLYPPQPTLSPLPLPHFTTTTVMTVVINLVANFPGQLSSNSGWLSLSACGVSSGGVRLANEGCGKGGMQKGRWEVGTEECGIGSVTRVYGSG